MHIDTNTKKYDTNTKALIVSTFTFENYIRGLILGWVGLVNPLKARDYILIKNTPKLPFLVQVPNF